MPALAELPILLVALLALALALLLNRIMESVANSIPSVHGLFDPLKSAVLAMGSGISYVLGKAEAGVDAAIGASWHALARLTDLMWKQLEGYALGYLQLAELVAKLVYSHSGLRVLVHHAEAVLHGIERGVKTFERKFHGIEHRVKVLEREYVGIDASHAGKRLGRLEHDLTRLEGRTIPAIQQVEEDAQSAISDLYNWVKGKASILGVGTLAEAIAAVLATVGLDWLACRSRNNVNGKSGCDLWNDIESVLGVALVTGLALDLPALIAEAQKVTPGIVSEFDKLAGLSN